MWNKNITSLLLERTWGMCINKIGDPVLVAVPGIWEERKESVKESPPPTIPTGPP